MIGYLPAHVKAPIAVELTASEAGPAAAIGGRGGKGTLIRPGRAGRCPTPAAIRQCSRWGRTLDMTLMREGLGHSALYVDLDKTRLLEFGRFDAS